MSENEEDLAARVKALEYQLHNLKQLVRRLNRKLSLETQPFGLSSGMGFAPVETEPEPEQRFVGLVEEVELETEEEVELDLEMETELETEEEVEIEFMEELPLSETVEEEDED